MLWLEDAAYLALMIGSSNFTQAGLGLGGSCNSEANLLFVARKRAYARETGKLIECWPETNSVSDPSSVEWTGSYLLEEDGLHESANAVPAGFAAARYQAGEPPMLILYLVPAKLPKNWRVLGGRNHDSVILDAELHRSQEKPTIVESPWNYEYAPGRLLVVWNEQQAFWPVNAEDKSRLPLPAGVESMTVEDLLAILAASDSSSAFRVWARKQQVNLQGGETRQDDLDIALPVELNPLSRYNLQETFMHRLRRNARLMAKVRSNLERPVWSEEALNWRLRGIFGVDRLAERLVQTFETGAKEERETVLTLADFLLMLSEVAYREASGALTSDNFNRIYRHYLHQLASRLHETIQAQRISLSSDLRSFWNKVYERCL
jgi:hypothetical protein